MPFYKKTFKKKYKVAIKLSGNSPVNSMMVAKKVITKNSITNVFVASEELERLKTAVQNGWLEIKNIKLDGKDITKEVLNPKKEKTTEPTQEEEVTEKIEENKEEVADPGTTEVAESTEENTEETVELGTTEELTLEQKAEKLAEEIIANDKNGRVNCPYCDKDYATTTASRYLPEHLVKEHADKL